jgi:MinD-like ATPase involved in chromosome partitioning or flagellar assembly
MSRVVAIAGAKGSPGCSFLAVALARRLADSRVPTLLLDADAEGGGVAAALDIGPCEVNKTDSADTLAMEIVQDLSFAETGPAGVEAFDSFAWLAAARQRYQAVLIDLGHSTGAMQRQLAAASDWLLWVVVPDRSGLQRADAAMAKGVLGAANVGLIFNRVRRGCLEGAEDALGSRHRLPLLARFSADQQVADRMAGGLAVHRLWSLRRPLRELARTIQLEVGATPPWR